MKKEETIKLAQKFAESHNAQAYPVQDFYLRPSNNQYGSPSAVPFPKERGVACVFDKLGDLIYVFIHTSWSNYFTGPKIAILELHWKKAIPHFVVSIILQADSSVDLNILADNLKNELIKQGKPCENVYN